MRGVMTDAVIVHQSAHLAHTYGANDGRYSRNLMRWSCKLLVSFASMLPLSLSSWALLAVMASLCPVF
jgi:hypothetical protein